MDERLKKQLDFALEIDKEKNILRQTHLSGGGRQENETSAYNRHRKKPAGSQKSVQNSFQEPP